MLIQIEDTIPAFVGISEANKQIARQAFENLTIAHRRGLHVVTGQPKTFKWLYEHLPCGEETRATLRKLQNDATQTATLSNNFGWHVRVVNPADALPRVTRADDKVTTYIPLARFADHELCNRTILLAENAMDIGVYAQFGKMYLASTRSPSLKINFDSRPGGGHTTAQNLADIQDQQNRLCLCLVDSDRRYPGAALGGTAAATNAVYDADSGLIWLYITPTHELENLLPPTHLQKIYLGEATKAQATLALMKVREADPEISQYLDIKAGFSIGTVMQTALGNPSRTYWDSKIAVLIQHGNAPKPAATACVQNSMCSSPENCACIILKPLGDKILNDFKDSIDGLSGPKLLAILKGEDSTKLMQVGRLVFEACCGTSGFLV